MISGHLCTLQRFTAIFVSFHNTKRASTSAEGQQNDVNDKIGEVKSFFKSFFMALWLNSGPRDDEEQKLKGVSWRSGMKIRIVLKSSL
jgi:hypothetical protein